MKPSLKRVLRTKEPQGNEWVQESDDVEIVELVESLEAQVVGLRAERDQLKAELSVAAGAARESEAEGFAPPRAPGRVRDYVAWWKLALLTVLVLAPWVVIGSIVWLLAA